jgi:hypothetical protein
MRKGKIGYIAIVYGLIQPMNKPIYAHLCLYASLGQVLKRVGPFLNGKLKPAKGGGFGKPFGCSMAMNR